MFLEKILAYKKKEVKERKKIISEKEIRKNVGNLPFPKDFKSAIKKEKVSLIAEIKKASPSKGIIVKDFNHLKIAKIYEENGADAISVLTEEKFFFGKLQFIKDVNSICSLPILRKDFIIDSYQIYETRNTGADALLLIASILSEKELKKLLKITYNLGMQALVEVHSKEELKKVLNTKAEIIGINNRDLKNFSVNLQTTFELIKFIPEDKTVVSESGISNKEEISQLAKCGVNAVLIGESLLKSRDVGDKLRELKS